MALQCLRFVGKTLPMTTTTHHCSICEALVAKGFHGTPQRKEFDLLASRFDTPDYSNPSFHDIYRAIITEDHGFYHPLQQLTGWQQIDLKWNQNFPLKCPKCPAVYILKPTWYEHNDTGLPAHWSVTIERMAAG